MAYPLCQTPGMQIDYTETETSELIACFGSAQLIKYLDGRFQLRGGTASDRQRACDWLEMFMPDVLEEI